MNCPHWTSPLTNEQRKKTILGYRTFRCTVCKHLFHERTGTPFTFLEFPTEVVFLVVLWRLRYKLSLRDVAGMVFERGFAFPHETVRDWEARFTPVFADQLRRKRHGQAGRSWYVDETYMKVQGKWCYLYRAIDQEGNLIDSLLSEKRDMEAAKRFLDKLSLLWVMLPSRSQRTDIPLIHGGYAKQWVIWYNIEQISTSITRWSKIIVESNSVTIHARFRNFCVSSSFLLCL